LEVKVTREFPAKTFQKDGETKLLKSIVLSDGTGEIKMTLFESWVDTVHEGMWIKIANAYVGEYQGKPQLNIKQDGKLEVIDDKGELTQQTLPASGPVEDVKVEKIEGASLGTQFDECRIKAETILSGDSDYSQASTGEKLDAKLRVAASLFIETNKRK